MARPVMFDIIRSFLGGLCLKEKKEEDEDTKEKKNRELNETKRNNQLQILPYKERLVLSFIDTRETFLLFDS